MNVNTVKIDEAIDRYVNERKTNVRKAAEARFLSYTYLACGENDVATFMRKTRSLIRYYINYLAVLENPLRGPQAGWLALMTLVLSFGIFMMCDDELRVAGFFIACGTLINEITLARAIVEKWVETAVTIAFYREIVELIDRTIPADC